jgi:hypothetical protein
MKTLSKNLPTDWGHWSVSPQVIEQFNEKTLGFVYKVTNKADNKFYIGKKQMYSIKKLKPLKGKRNKRLVEVETDWKTYTTSSNIINEDISKYGKDKFDFEILQFCNSKSQLAYREAKQQFDEDVLLNENSYNGIINCRLSRISK